MSGYGAEGFLSMLLPLLQSGGAEVAVLTVYPPGITDEQRATIGATILSANRKQPLNVSFIGRMASMVKRWKPHIVHTHTHNGKYWGRLVASMVGVPILLHTEHNPCDTRRTLVERLADRRLNDRTDLIITFTRLQGMHLARLEGFPERKVRVIPNGIRHRPPPDETQRRAGRARLGVGEHEFAVLVVGRLEEQKNQQLALRAVRELGDEARRRITVFFVGGGSDEPSLRSLADNLGVNASVRFFGFRADLPSLLPGADLLLMTSLFEGMPLAAIEAMSAGIPVATTPWVGAQEMFAHGRAANIACDWEPAAIGQVVATAMSTPLDLARIADVGQRLARTEYDIGTCAMRHMEMYQTAFAGVSKR
ncbi:MAG: glycosyltransferase family 4 protein [Candidatus Eremiobacteraeota bacterium]|nr:glycosyltransferase family 4 protein [Candidatus Eremiobacteraeota bacterium]